ncbi:MAG: N-6 DNA methylase [Planctomycetaceae bacterium]|jgi:type I restriction-modification system DNA methylase subunit|nr:N-6 DNA methylase [Planctomycetaceae bacterium]
MSDSKINAVAAENMRNLYSRLFESGLCGHWLDVYLLRILFCFFADKVGIFEHNLFVNYIQRKVNSREKNIGLHLNAIFETLNTPESQRCREIDRYLNKFPYIKYSLFDERFEIIEFDSAVNEALTKCCFIDWDKVSPEIFGEIFQSLMNCDERRKHGVHYTSEKNILKLIKPLFMDDLRNEFYRYKKLRSCNRRKLLIEFHNKLPQLKFLDPACGCGNFLVIAYRELRILEIDVLRELLSDGSYSHITDLVKVSVDQFFGIELAEFPSQIAQIAMCLMDNRMNKLVRAEFDQNFSRVLFDKTVSICCANAFEIDWGIIVTKNQLSYIFGNPPFLGSRLMNERQKSELYREFNKIKKCGELDYVTAWFKRAAAFIRGTNIEVAFVATNSICQGEQVAVLWRELIERCRVKINFAHQTFKWDDYGNENAAVNCVIIGFSLIERDTKRLFWYENVNSCANEKCVKRINAYLAEADDIFIESRPISICDVPKINFGNQPIDGGFLTLTPEERMLAIKDEPEIERFIRRYVGSYEFINNVERYCLWLKDVNEDELKNFKFIVERLELVRNFRLSSPRAETRKLAAEPARFAFISHNDNDYIIIPGVSSERREYLPIGFMSGDIIASNACFVISDCDLYLFAILMSRMHNVWMSYVCGRLEMRYRYSASIVYNNFPFPLEPDLVLRQKIIYTVRNILVIREKSKKSIAELYDSDTMPIELANLHRKLDKLIDQVYGHIFENDSARITFLFDLYQKNLKFKI